MKITTFSRPTVKSILKEVNATMGILRERLAKYGLEVKTDGCRFSSTEMKPRLKITVSGGQETEFVRHASRFGLKPDWFGKTVTLGLHDFKIVGICPRKFKNPVSLERLPDGKGFKCSADAVIQAVGAALAKEVKRVTLKL